MDEVAPNSPRKATRTAYRPRPGSCTIANKRPSGRSGRETRTPPRRAGPARRMRRSTLPARAPWTLLTLRVRRLGAIRTLINLMQVSAFRPPSDFAVNGESAPKRAGRSWRHAECVNRLAPLTGAQDAHHRCAGNASAGETATTRRCFSSRPAGANAIAVVVGYRIVSGPPDCRDGPHTPCPRSCG